MESLLIWIVGLLAGIAITKIYQGIKNNNLAFKWYHWLVGIAWYGMCLFILLFITTSFAENAPQAAGMAILIFGGGILVVTILLYRFLFSKVFKKDSNEAVKI